MGGKADAVELLLQRRANVNALTNAETTALSMAASRDHREVILLLLSYAADRTIANVRRSHSLARSLARHRLNRCLLGISLDGSQRSNIRPDRLSGDSASSRLVAQYRTNQRHLATLRLTPPRSTHLVGARRR